jgi:lysophospholipase L1-like esterase
LLGGTNDLAWGKSASTIHDALLSITDIPLNCGAKLLLFTVPECASKQGSSLDARRDELNELIKGDGRENVYTFDLHEKIPYHSMDPEERMTIWDDGLHFTVKGYERMGNMVAERFIELLDAEEKEE